MTKFLKQASSTYAYIYIQNLPSWHFLFHLLNPLFSSSWQQHNTFWDMEDITNSGREYVRIYTIRYSYILVSVDNTYRLWVTTL